MWGICMTVSKKKIVLLWFLALVAVIGFLLRDYIIPHRWNYKITVEIETPEGVKTGSAVRQVVARKNIAKFLNPDLRDIQYDVIGEAVVIQVDKDKYLFSLPNYQVFLKTFLGNQSTDDELFYVLNSIHVNDRKKIDIEENMFVAFENISDPSTIFTVRQNTVFGQKILRKEAFIERVNSPVTHGNVRKVLVWLDSKKMGEAVWQKDKADPAAYLDKSNFVKEYQ